MLKDFTEERNGVEKGCLVLSQDCFFACIRPEYECLQSLIRLGLRLKSVWMQRRMMSLNLTPPTLRWIQIISYSTTCQPAKEYTNLQLSNLTKRSGSSPSKLLAGQWSPMQLVCHSPERPSSSWCSFKGQILLLKWESKNWLSNDLF